MEADEVTSVWGQWIGAGVEAQEMDEFRRLMLGRRRLARAIAWLYLVAVVVVITYAIGSEPVVGVPAAVLFLAVSVNGRRDVRRQREHLNARTSEMRASDSGIEGRSRTHTEWASWDRVSAVVVGSRVVVLVTASHGWIFATRHFPSKAAVDDFVVRARNLANSTGPLEVVEPSEPASSESVSPSDPGDRETGAGAA